ncbi:hypothetical protein [Novosphingobium sp. PASSN1]|uniref:hypothetical protein n=1 Tax=Novosphingobium sp. PASSN1 TaxID=2015561 RepID=UPI000BD0B7DA|nr:hypothetical protein [Novosphingobium sp. PASSN1]OYU37064.1 MAG: hypothetical protein CFE35_01400 [Novosphingobium sp. PASSN1]
MRRGRNHDWRGAPLALAVLAAPVAVDAQEADEPAQDSLRVSVGATYTDGRYGQTTRTEIATVPVSVKYTRSRFSVQVTTSYVTLRGPGTLLDGGTGGGTSGSSSGSGSSGSGVASEPEFEDESGDDSGGGGSADGSGSGSGGGSDGSSGSGSGGGVDDGGSSGGSSGGSDDGSGTGTGAVTGGAPPLGAAAVTPVPRQRRSGMGDTAVTLAYSLPLGGGISFEPRTRVKLPTASARKGIGTGKVDVTLAADLVGSFGSTTVYASARRRFLGRSPRFAVRDGWGFSGGVSQQIGAVFTVGADYDWLQSATPRRGPISEGTVWVSARLSSKLRLQAYGGTGFTARSAETIGGLALVWRP